MSARTIAEYFVDRGRIRLKLEIGLDDLETFRNLLPDEIYERLGHAPRPLAERLRDFFERDLAISVENGDPLHGQVREIGPRPRVRRDEITGEPLAEGSAEPEVVVFARIDYTLPDEPTTLTLRGPASAATDAPDQIAGHAGEAGALIGGRLQERADDVVHVAAGAERLPGSSDDHGAHRFPGRERRERALELTDQAGRQWRAVTH